MKKESDCRTYDTDVLSTGMGLFWVTYFHYFRLRHSLCRRVLVHFLGTHEHKVEEEHNISTTDRQEDKSGEQDDYTYASRLPQ